MTLLSTYAPGAAPSISGNNLTVDMLVNPVHEIAPTIYGLVEEDQGYILDDLLTVGPIVAGSSSVKYTEDDPTLAELDAARGLAPRAPGADAVDIGASLGDQKLAEAESWAGTITVTDEHVRWNQAFEVQSQFRAAANSFSQRMQARGISLTKTFLAAKSRTVTAGTKWNTAWTSGLVNVDPATLPMASIMLAKKKFHTDKSGITPDTLLAHSTDAYYLGLAYGDRLEGLLAMQGLTLKVSDLVTLGQPIVLKSGSLGYVLPEKPLDTEQQRFPRAKKDEYTLETSLIFVPKNAFGGVIITGANA